MLNVVNTAKNNSLVKKVFEIKLERGKKFLEQTPIIITNEFLTLFEQFKPISNGLKPGGRLTLK